MAEVRLWTVSLAAEELRGGLTGAPGPADPRLAGRWLHSTDPAVADGTTLPEHLAAVEPQLWLTPGRFYLGGLVCENRAFAAVEPVAATGLHLAELVATQRVVSAIEDPAIAEIALGGVDTTVRTRVDWRIDFSDPAAPPRIEPPPPRMQARRRMVSETLTNTLYRVEIHHAGWPAGGGAAGAVELEVRAIDPVASRMTLAVGDRGADLPAGRPVEITDAGERLVGWVESADTAAGTIVVDVVPKAAEPGRTVGVRPIASYKWARDNASVSAQVVQVAGRKATLRAGPRAASLIRRGMWAEFAATGKGPAPAAMALIEEVERPQSGELAVRVAEEDAAGIADAATLTLWQPAEAAPEHGVVAVRAGAWQPVENGVEVRFAEAVWLPGGAAWTLPARDEIQGILWPQADGAPEAVEAVLPVERRAPLALVSVGNGLMARDLRRVFVSLSSLAVPGDAHPPGSLDVRGDLLVGHDARVGGTLSAGLIEGVLGPDTVGTRQVRDRSITEAKLAMRDGLVPYGASLLGETRAAPPGFAFTGETVTGHVETLAWGRLSARLPAAGRVVAAAAGGWIYLLWEEGRFCRYDPDVGAFEDLPDMPDAPRRGCTLTEMAGRLYLVGGAYPDGTHAAVLRVYDPERESWEERARLIWPRSHHGAVAAGGRLCVFGGRRRVLGGLVRDWVTAAVEVYDPGRDVWFRSRAMPAARSDMAVAADPFVARLVGGRARRFWGLFGTRVTGWHQEFAPGEGVWRWRRPMPYPGTGVSAGTAGDVTVAFGGHRVDGTAAGTHVFDRRSGHWRDGPLPDRPRSHVAAVVSDGTLFALGGIESEGNDPGMASGEAMPLQRTYFVHRRTGTMPAEAPLMLRPR